MYGGVAYEAKHRRTGTSWNDPVAWLQVRSLPPSLAKERVNVTAVLFGAAVSVPFCVKRALRLTVTLAVTQGQSALHKPEGERVDHLSSWRGNKCSRVDHPTDMLVRGQPTALPGDALEDTLERQRTGKPRSARLDFAGGE